MNRKKRKIIENIEDFEKKIIQIRTKDEDDKSKLPKGIGLLIAERFKVEGKGIGTLRELLDAKIKEQVLLPLQTPEYYLGYLEIEKAKKPIHFCAYSSQPDIQIFCDDSWTTPSWTQQPKTIPEVYLADNQELYTFNRELVTCDKCKEKNNDNIDN